MQNTAKNEYFKYKQVIIVRTDLKMGKGKIAAQVAHAAVSAMEKTKKFHKKWVKRWLQEGQKKVVLKVKSEEELIELKRILDKKDIPYVLIQDRGLTQIPPGSITALGIGPCPQELINPITNELPLL
ncbi:MAG: peptidyl-tRNA hydrolase Pth2 [Candidatus Helarchaeota archaeon]